MIKALIRCAVVANCSNHSNITQMEISRIVHAVLVKSMCRFCNVHAILIEINAIFVRVHTLYVIVYVLFVNVLVHAFFGFLKLSALRTPSVKMPHTIHVCFHGVNNMSRSKRPCECVCIVGALSI